MEYQTYMVKDQSGNCIRFADICQAIPVVISRNPNKPCTVKVEKDSIHAFKDAVLKQGWTAELIEE